MSEYLNLDHRLMKGLLILFFLLWTFSGSSQEIQHSFSLDEVDFSTALKEVEKAFDIKFSYKASIVKNKKVTLKIENAPLTEVLAVLQQQEKLVIEQIDTRYYILKERNTVFCGYLNDLNDGSPIVGAAIADLHNGTGAISDNEGYFELKNTASTEMISISFLGYETLVLNPNDFISSECQTYTMKMNPEVLQEVVIREYLTRGISKNQDGSVRLSPTRQDILSGLAEPDVLQSTQLLPGIESPSETASGLYIRGGTPDQNLILWDGIKMYNSDHFFGMLSAFNPYIVKDVRVYRSGARPEYGDRVSGILDIKTDDQVPEKTTGGMGFNMTHADAHLKIPLSKKVGLMLSSRRAFTDAFDTPTFTKFSEKVFQNTSIRRNQEVFEPEFTEGRESFYFSDVTLKTIATLSDSDKVTISALSTRNKLDYSFRDVEFDDASSDNLRVENTGVSALWTSKWSYKLKTKAQLYYSTYNLDYEGQNVFFNAEQTTAKKNNIKETGLSFTLDWEINNKWSLVNGYQFFNNKVNYRLQFDDFLEGDTNNGPTHVLFHNLTYQFQKGYVQAGLRNSYYVGLNKFFLEPRIYTEWKAAPHFSFKASGELRGQAISQILELATQDFGLENQIWALANEDDIPFLRNQQFSGGLLWSQKGLSIDLDTYYKNTKGLTSFTRGFESAVSDFSEGKSITKGIDLLVKKKWNRYSTWLGYTYSDTDFKFGELNDGEVFRGNNDITHSITWSHFYKWKNLQFSLGWRYRTGIPFTEALGIAGEGEDIEIDFDTLNGETLPDYHRLDFSVLYDIVLAKKENPITAKLGFSLMNLYGRRNILNKNYGLFEVFDEQNESTIELQEITRYSLGITPNLVFRLNF